MSIVIFFGLTTAVILFGFVYVGLTLRHHWKNPGKNTKKSVVKTQPLGSNSGDGIE